MLHKYPSTLDGSQRARKRLFIALALVTAIGLCLLLVAAWIIPYVGFARIHPVVPGIMLAFFGLAVLAVALCTAILIRSIYTGRRCFGSRRVRGIATRLLLPFMELVARGVGIGTQNLRHSFIKVNNEFVLSDTPPVKPEELLILLPHCIQITTCAQRLTHSVDNCRRCGKCPIVDMLELRDRYGVKLAVATGGTIARRIVATTRPRLILAVACERDLTSGIQDTYPLSVYGVLNERPKGPCIDTLVCAATVESVIRNFLRADSPPAAPDDEERSTKQNEEQNKEQMTEH